MGNLIIMITNYSRMSNGAEAQAKQTKKVNELIVLSNATLTEDEKKLRIGIYNYAKNAIADACTLTNPRKPTQEEMEKLLKACYYDTEVDF